MRRGIKKASRKAGLPPGTLVHIGEKRHAETHIRLIDYEETDLRETEVRKIESALPFKKHPTVSWINIDGLQDLDLIQRIGNGFAIHPLTLEDIVHTGQRPKAEEFDHYVYVVLNMLRYDPAERHIRAEQVSLVLGDRYLMSFQEIPGDVFEGVRERLRKGKGRIRRSGADYLLYALMDAVVDQYFIILETFGEKIEGMEEDLLANPTTEILQGLHDMKREMIFFRKQVWPLREILSSLSKREMDLITEATGVFLRDVYDHTIQVVDTIESYRDILSGMVDIYLSTVSNRMNEVIKVLTIIATIFIPLTFVAGIYGMNFQYMPELRWPWGYLWFWGLVVATATGMLIFFRRKKWL
jgi:magnesium transporter